MNIDKETEQIFGLEQDVINRINYLVHKTDKNQSSVSFKDLGLAYESAKINVRMMEETCTPMFELFFLDKYSARCCDIKIVQLYDQINGKTESKVMAKLRNAY